MAYKSLADLQEEEQLMGSMDEYQQDRLMIPPAQPDSIIPSETPQEMQQQAKAPIMEAAEPSAKAEANQPKYYEKSQSDLDRLEKMLADARQSDRALKIGGALGDALATYINAQGQMNAKIPGVQVQQGAGLGKIADMFATAPEIQSDIAGRRKQLLEEYKAMAKKNQEITPYQAESLKLKREDQKIRERSIEELNRRFGSSLELRKGAQEFKEKEKNELSDKQVESMASFDKVQGLSDELKIRADKFRDKLGPYAASVEQYKSLVPGFQEDPDFAAFRASTTDTLSQYIKSLSGLTVSDKERASLLKSVPTVNDKYDIFMSKMEELQKRLDRYKNAELEAAKKYQGKNIPEQKPIEQKSSLSPKDQQALDWANKNPNDPRSIEIKKRLGM